MGDSSHADTQLMFARLKLCHGLVPRQFLTSTARPQLSPEIIELHREACDRKERTYDDPETGLKVFTEYNHLERGVCCGSACRHCAYNWENVKTKATRTVKPTT